MAKRTSTEAGAVEELWAIYEGLASERVELACQAEAKWAAYEPRCQAALAAFDAGRGEDGAALAEESEALYEDYRQAVNCCEVAMDAEEAAYVVWQAAFERQQERLAAG
jgi:hypothetical protein